MTNRRAGGGLVCFPRPKQRRDSQEKLPDHIHNILPVVDAYGHQCSKMEQHRKEEVGLLRILSAEKILEQGQVAGAGNGQELRHALKKAHGNGKQVTHNGSP